MAQGLDDRSQDLDEVASLTMLAFQDSQGNFILHREHFFHGATPSGTRRPTRGL